MPAGPSSRAAKGVWLGARGSKEGWGAGARAGSSGDIPENAPEV